MSKINRWRWLELIGIFVGIVFFAPIVAIFMMSVAEIGPADPAFNSVGGSWRWSNYIQLFDLLPFGRYLRNSLFVVAVAVPITLLTASWGGFALVRFPAKWQRPIIRIIILTLFIPGAAVWLFRFQLYQQMGIINTHWSLILPAVGGTAPLFILLYYWSFRAIPTALFDAAELDGGSPIILWWFIARPLVRPTTRAVGLLSTFLYWGDFLQPILFLYDRQLYTLPIGLQLLNQLDRTNAPLLMAAAIIMMAPIVVLLLWWQRDLSAVLSPQYINLRRQ